MSVYVGIDVHRKRSQVAVVTEDGEGAAEPERCQLGGAGLEADRQLVPEPEDIERAQRAVGR
jgi:hypothetical protein